MANLNDLKSPWSDKLPQDLQSIDFEISENFSSLGVTPEKLATESQVQIISEISEQVFNNLGRNTEALFGTDFISYVVLQVVFDEILTSNFINLFNTSSYVDLLQECVISCKFKGVSFNCSELISQTYFEYNQFNQGLTTSYIDTYDWNLDELNSYLKGISASFKDQFFVEYLNTINNVFFQFISENSKQDFINLVNSINDIVTQQAHLESRLEAQRLQDIQEIIDSYDLKGDSTIILGSDYEANAYSKKAYDKTGKLIRIQDLYKLKKQSTNPITPNKKAKAKKDKRKAQKKARKKNR